MKPPGIQMGINQNGSLSMRVTRSNTAIDAIWEAVREAISSGMEPKEFLSEVREAWSSEMDEQKRYAMRELENPNG